MRQLDIRILDALYPSLEATFSWLINFTEVDSTTGDVVMPPTEERHPTSPAAAGICMWRYTVACRLDGPMTDMPPSAAAVALQRDLPIKEWRVVSRAALLRAARGSELATLIRPTHDEAVPVKVPDLPDTPQKIEEAAGHAVYARLPFQMPDDVSKLSPGERRHLESQLKLSRTAVHYARLVAEGRQDPAAEIARIFGVAPATARSWIFRARQQGYLVDIDELVAGKWSGWEQLPPEEGTA